MNIMKEEDYLPLREVVFMTLRKQILQDLGLPEYLTANAMLAALNCLFGKKEFEAYLTRILHQTL